LVIFFLPSEPNRLPRRAGLLLHDDEFPAILPTSTAAMTTIPFDHHLRIPIHAHEIQANFQEAPMISKAITGR
jgi:hypothetical protein